MNGFVIYNVALALNIFSDISETLNGFIESIIIAFCTSLKNHVINNIGKITQSFYNNLGGISGNLTKTPETFNSGIFATIKNISDNVILPFGVTVLTFVICYEILQMLMEKNRMNEIDMNHVFLIVFKMMIALYILNNSFSITMAFFDVAGSVTSQVSNVVNSITDAEESQDAWDNVIDEINNLENNGETAITLVALVIITYILQFVMFFMSMAVLIITYSRFIEIYIYCSVSPLTYSTLINKEWGQIGMNYIRSLLALAFQAVFMMLVAGMYVGLIEGFTMSFNGSIYYQMLGCLGSSIILVMSLAKTRDISKSIFNAH